MYKYKDPLRFSIALRLKILLFIFLFYKVDTFAQLKNQDEYLKALEYIDSRGEVYLRIPFTGAGQVQDLSVFLSVDHVSDGDVYLYANRQGFQELSNRRITYHVEIPPSLIRPVRMEKEQFPDPEWDSYPAFSQYKELMNRYADSFPAICSLDTIGFSVYNREIIVVKISDNVGLNEDEPGFFYTSTIHGDELTGYILMIRLVDYLLNQYGRDEKVTKLVDHLQIWINPLANPDGTYRMGDHTIYGATRFNANAVDLNRNYPDPDEGPHPDGLDYQPENLAMMIFMHSLHLVMSANLHTGAEVVNYPWDTWPELHPDDDWFRLVSRQYADTAHLYNDLYMTRFDNGITNGYAWYTISGGRQDYVTYFLNGREITLELSTEKIPPADTLPFLWEYNYRSFLNYMEQCLYGIRGKVTDGKTGLPLRSKIETDGHDDRNSHVWSDSITGRYYRLISGGIYNLLVSADGYHDTLVTGIHVTDFEPAEMDIVLFPLIQDSIIKDTIIFGPNPFSDRLTIDIWSEYPAVVGISLFDPVGKMIVPESSKSLIRGKNSIILDGYHLKPGLYILRIRQLSGTKAIKVIRLE